MSSIKAMICDVCLILFFGLTVVFAEEAPITSNLNGTSNIPSGNCSCGGFASLNIEPDTAPLLWQTPGLVVKCDDEGKNTCKSLCNALATATKAKGPEILCNKLKEANELKLSAFFKICDQAWLYADLTAENPLCCTEGNVKTCPSVAVQNATTPVVIDAKTIM